MVVSVLIYIYINFYIKSWSLEACSKIHNDERADRVVKVIRTCVFAVTLI